MGYNILASWCVTTFICKWGFFVERGSHMHQYMLEPIPFSIIRAITSMWPSSHALCCETGHWGTSDDSDRLCTLCIKQVWESEYHTLIQFSAFDHIRLSFHASSTKLNSCINLSHNHNVHSWLQHSLVKFLNVESRHSLSHDIIWNIIFWVS